MTTQWTQDAINKMEAQAEEQEWRIFEAAKVGESNVAIFTIGEIDLKVKPDGRWSAEYRRDDKYFYVGEGDLPYAYDAQREVELKMIDA